MIVIAYKDLTGVRFGRLECLKVVGREASSRCVVWLCRCDCGAMVAVRSTSLLTGNTKSCGCLQREKARSQAASRAKHNGCGTRLYRIWKHMKERCQNPNNKDYSNYGGRGIYVCDEWLDFAKFRDWALANGYRDDLTIERIDVNGPYAPSNCIWIPKAAQNRNTRATRRVTFAGRTLTLREWAEATGIPWNTLRNRLAKGWPFERAITEPIHRNKQREKRAAKSVAPA